jgi:hypothetical protein
MEKRNEVIREKCQHHKIFWKDRKKMLKLYGHVVRRQDNRWPERIMSWLPEESGQRGRSEVRWEKAVEREMKQRNLTYDDSVIWQIWRLELGKSWNNGKVNDK